MNFDVFFFFEIEGFEQFSMNGSFILFGVLGPQSNGRKSL